jgi:hypothetical protein
MTEREEYDAWVEENFNRYRLPRICAEFGFEAWRAGRQSLIDASGAPVEIRTLDGDAL